MSAERADVGNRKDRVHAKLLFDGQVVVMRHGHFQVPQRKRSAERAWKRAIHQLEQTTQWQSGVKLINCSRQSEGNEATGPGANKSNPWIEKREQAGAGRSIEAAKVERHESGKDIP